MWCRRAVRCGGPEERGLWALLYINTANHSDHTRISITSDTRRIMLDMDRAQEYWDSDAGDQRAAGAGAGSDAVMVGPGMPDVPRERGEHTGTGASALAPASGTTEAARTGAVFASQNAELPRWSPASQSSTAGSANAPSAAAAAAAASVWQLALAIGRFADRPSANTFCAAWTFRCRGAISRVARGEILARQFGLAIYGDLRVIFRDGDAYRFVRSMPQPPATATAAVAAVATQEKSAPRHGGRDAAPASSARVQTTLK